MRGVAPGRRGTRAPRRRPESRRGPRGCASNGSPVASVPFRHDPEVDAPAARASANALDHLRIPETDSELVARQARLRRLELRLARAEDVAHVNGVRRKSPDRQVLAEVRGLEIVPEGSRATSRSPRPRTRKPPCTPRRERSDRTAGLRPGCDGGPGPDRRPGDLKIDVTTSRPCHRTSRGAPTETVSIVIAIIEECYAARRAPGFRQEKDLAEPSGQPRPGSLVLVLEEDVGLAPGLRADPVGPRRKLRLAVVLSAQPQVAPARRRPMGVASSSSSAQQRAAPASRERREDLLVEPGLVPELERRADGAAAAAPGSPRRRGRSFFRFGGSWKSTGPSRSPSVVATCEEVGDRLPRVLQPLAVRDLLRRPSARTRSRRAPARPSSRAATPAASGRTCC